MNNKRKQLQIHEEVCNKD